MIWLGITSLIVSICLFTYGAYPPVSDAVDNWFYVRRLRRIERMVNRNGKK